MLRRKKERRSSWKSDLKLWDSITPKTMLLRGRKVFVKTLEETVSIILHVLFQPQRTVTWFALSPRAVLPLLKGQSGEKKCAKARKPATAWKLNASVAMGFRNRFKSYNCLFANKKRFRRTVSLKSKLLNLLFVWKYGLNNVFFDHLHSFCCVRN